MSAVERYALLAALLLASHWTGRLAAAKNCEKQKAESAAEAIDEKNDDDQAQGESAASSDRALLAEISRLTRKLETAYVPTGLACDEPGSGDVVHDAYDALFEEGLPAGR